MRTALFTGAGASAAIGYPLTREILPAVRKGLVDGSLFEGMQDATRQRARAKHREDRESLAEYLNVLYPGLEAAHDDELPLITDLFSLVEYALANGEALPVGGASRLTHLRDLLKQAITAVILGEYLQDWNLRSSVDRQRKQLLDALVTWFEAQHSNVALVTTNYDIGLEGEIYGDDSNRQRIYGTIDLGCDYSIPAK